jgi:two-component system sensor kinase FixL
VLSNAVEAQRSVAITEPVEVFLGSDAETVEITVVDHGPGIEEGKLEKLFDPFVTGRADGVGLGLALTRRIVLLHAGRITVGSTEGGGATFLLELPRGKHVTKGND